MDSMQQSINVGGRLMSLCEPRVMGILNLTPDSFYAGSRSQTEADVERRVAQLVEEGADIIDVGACSTRPDSTPATEAQEMERLRWGLTALRRVAPDAVVSVDTFRAPVARLCVEEYDAAIVNDISGGSLDPEMFPEVARLGVPYVLTHYSTRPDVDLITGMLQDLAESINRLHAMGVCDILVDPGFGFGKTLDQNYELMQRLQELDALGLPLLVGVSRKSMIYKLLSCSPEEALNGTTVLHTIALSKGARILRTHDVRQAVETIKITRKLCSNSE